MPSSPGAPHLPGYRDLTLIGRGGFSEVHRAWQERFDRWVAVKVLSIAMRDDRTQERFRRECRVTGRLSGHPSVVVVHDADIAPDGRPFLAMQLYEGGSALDRMRSADGPLPLRDVLHWSIQVAGALETAHRAGVLHRDVKPGNILLTAFGQAALSDFGLSIVAEQQEISLGIDAITPNHAAPEVLERGEASVATDVFALASTVYTLLAGQAPHPVRPGEGPGSRLLRMLQDPVPAMGRPDLPPRLEEVLQVSLAREPGDRPRSARVLGELLQEVQRDEQLPPTEMTVLEGQLAPPLAPAPLAPPPGDTTLPRRDTPPPEASGNGATADLPTTDVSGRPWEPSPSVGLPEEATVARPRSRPPATSEADLPAAPSAVPWPIVVLAVVLVVGVLGVLGSLLLDRGSDDEPGTTTTTAAHVPDDVVSDVTAEVTGAGLRVAWVGREDASYVLLVLSEAAAPRSVPSSGTETILDPDDFPPDEGHCIAVAYADAMLAAPPGQETAAFSPPTCVNGASQDTVRTE